MARRLPSPETLNRYRKAARRAGDRAAAGEISPERAREIRARYSGAVKRYREAGEPVPKAPRSGARPPSREQIERAERREMERAARAEVAAQRAAARREAAERGDRPSRAIQGPTVRPDSAPTSPPAPKPGAATPPPTPAESRPARAPRETVAKVRESMRRQGLKGKELRNAVSRWEYADRKQRKAAAAARSSEPAPQVPADAADTIPGYERFAAAMDQRVAEGTLTPEQRDRAIAGYVRGQAKAREAAAAAKANAAAAKAARTPEQIKADDDKRRAKSAERHARKREQNNQRRARNRERVRSMRTYREGERIPIEGSALRSGEPGGSFEATAEIAAASLLDKFARSTLSRDGGALSGVTAMDSNGNAIAIPDTVVAQGAGAIAEWIEERAAEGEIDSEWIMLEAGEYDYDDGDVYSANATA